MATDDHSESPSLVTAETLDLHRALVSLREELEAIDWYQQRADACTDPELKQILLHNRREEVEHAVMLMEWVRRCGRDFDQPMRTYLFTERPITMIESVTANGAPAASASQSLAIGSMKGREPWTS